MLFFFTYLCRNADPCMTTRNLPCGFLDDLEKNMNPTFCAGILQFDRLNFFFAIQNHAKKTFSTSKDYIM